MSRIRASKQKHSPFREARDSDPERVDGRRKCVLKYHIRPQEKKGAVPIITEDQIP